MKRKKMFFLLFFGLIVTQTSLGCFSLCPILKNIREKFQNKSKVVSPELEITNEKTLPQKKEIAPETKSVFVRMVSLFTSPFYSAWGYGRRVYYGVQYRKACDDADDNKMDNILAKFTSKEDKEDVRLRARRTPFNWMFLDMVPFL